MDLNPLRRAFSWYFTKGALPYWSVLALDCVIMIVAGLVAFTLNHGATSTAEVFYPLIGTLCLYLVVYIISFRAFHTYSGIIRFSSFVDLQRLGIAVLVGLVAVIALQVGFSLNHYLVELWISDLILAAIIAVTFMWTVRIWVKRVYDATINNKEKTAKAFIYGVMSGGISLAKSINQPESPFTLAGFVSDDEDLRSKRLMGVPVYPNDGNLLDEMHKNGAAALLVSPLRSEALRNNNEMVNALIYGGIKIYMVPSATEWDGHSDLTHSHLKEVRIEDLLPRAEIEVDMKAIGKMLGGKRILVTGAAGSIGSEITCQIAAFGPEKLVLIDQAETPLHDIRLMMARQFPEVDAPTIVSDICNESRMTEIFRKYRPEYVFHAAAYKHVPMMEDNPVESVRNNVLGTRIVADLALRTDTRKFV